MSHRPTAAALLRRTRLAEAAFLGISTCNLGVCFTHLGSSQAPGLGVVGLVALQGLCLIVTLQLRQRTDRRKKEEEDEAAAQEEKARAAAALAEAPPADPPPAAIADHEIHWDNLRAHVPEEAVARLRAVVDAARPFEKRWRTLPAPADPVGRIALLSADTSDPMCPWCDHDKSISVLESTHTDWTSIADLADELDAHPTASPLVRALVAAFVTDADLGRALGLHLKDTLTALRRWTVHEERAVRLGQDWLARRAPDTADASAPDTLVVADLLPAVGAGSATAGHLRQSGTEHAPPSDSDPFWEPVNTQRLHPAQARSARAVPLQDRAS